MRKIGSMMFGAAAMLAVAGSAFAGFSTGVQTGPLDSNGAAGNVLNGVFTFNYAGPAFFPGNFRFSGTLTDNGVGTWSSEARWRVIAPSGETFTMTSGLAGSSNTTPGPFVASNVTVNTGGALAGVANSVGTWTFRAFESANDGGNTVDGFWSDFSFDFDDFVPPTPPAAIDLGTFMPGGMLMGTAPYVSNTVQWYKFTLSSPIPAGELWRVHTFGNTLTGGQFGNGDTEIALFNSLGSLLGNNDDFGSFRESNLQGTAGLAAGDYYIAASAYNMAVSAGFNATVVDSVVSGGVVTGDIKVTITPAPGAAALLGLGGLLAARRRRA